MSNIQVQYADFIRLCNVDDPESWAPGFRVAPDGVWVVPPPDNVDLLPEERAVLSEHPQGDLSKVALAFPCSLEDFQQFILWSGLNGCVVQSKLENFLKRNKANEPKEKFVERMKANGKTPVEIAHALIEKYGRFTDHKLGSLLPANPGDEIEYDSVRKQGQRLRKKAKKKYGSERKEK